MNPRNGIFDQNDPLERRPLRLHDGLHELFGGAIHVAGDGEPLDEALSHADELFPDEIGRRKPCERYTRNIIVNSPIPVT